MTLTATVTACDRAIEAVERATPSDVRAAYVHRIIDGIRQGKFMSGAGLVALQSAALNPDARTLVDALTYLATADAYEDPTYDDGSAPLGRSWQRAIHNSLRREEALRQYAACVAVLAASADEVSAA